MISPDFFSVKGLKRNLQENGVEFSGSAKKKDLIAACKHFRLKAFSKDDLLVKHQALYTETEAVKEETPDGVSTVVVTNDERCSTPEKAEPLDSPIKEEHTPACLPGTSSSSTSVENNIRSATEIVNDKPSLTSLNERTMTSLLPLRCQGQMRPPQLQTTLSGTAPVVKNESPTNIFQYSHETKHQTEVYNPVAAIYGDSSDVN
eukprot:GHVH01016429.1.p1 GENE.GHVH01016429.1~~GHVH01016429.1.p1  ORF type:complete len:204 (-),score=26.61 GHVH01016429.1:77-688(-)